MSPSRYWLRGRFEKNPDDSAFGFVDVELGSVVASCCDCNAAGGVARTDPALKIPKTSTKWTGANAFAFP